MIMIHLLELIGPYLLRSQIKCTKLSAKCNRLRVLMESLDEQKACKRRMKFEQMWKRLTNILSYNKNKYYQKNNKIKILTQAEKILHH